jgi:hypothetical protein
VLANSSLQDCCRHLAARAAQSVHRQPDCSDRGRKARIGRGRGAVSRGIDCDARRSERGIGVRPRWIVDRVIDLPSRGRIADHRDADVHRASAMPVRLLPRRGAYRRLDYVDRLHFRTLASSGRWFRLAWHPLRHQCGLNFANVRANRARLPVVPLSCLCASANSCGVSPAL